MDDRQRIDANGEGERTSEWQVRGEKWASLKLGFCRASGMGGKRCTVDRTGQSHCGIANKRVRDAVCGRASIDWM